MFKETLDGYISIIKEDVIGKHTADEWFNILASIGLVAFLVMLWHFCL